MRILPRIVWLIWFIVLLVLTAALSVGGWRAYVCRRWPTAEGTVIGFYGTPDYRYVVDGRGYTNSKVSCNEFFNDQLWAQNSSKNAVRYPPGAKVSVHYYPGNPMISALETKFDSRIIVVVVLLFLMTGLCGAGFVFGWPLHGYLRWPS